jgi:hypothetical protein
MIRVMPLRLGALPIGLTLAAAACCWSSASAAQSASSPAAPPAAADTVRLTDEQRLAILDTNTPESAAAARGELTGADARRGIHGEVGVMIGTNGTRGAYGTAEIPLGDKGSAVVSVESSRFGYRR